MKKPLLFVSISLFCLALMVTGQTPDGYILGGQSESYTHGMYDFLVYKIDATGAKQWRKNYGGEKDDYGWFVQQTSDGGYILVGDGESYTNGGSDILVYKVDAAGAKQWRKNYGGGNEETGKHIQQTADGGYILIGKGNTYTNGDYDVLIYKIDATGKKQWRKNYGGPDSDHGAYIEQTSDGGYIMLAWTLSYIHGTEYLGDLLLYKINATGVKQWRKNYGGVGFENGYEIHQTTDEGYIMAGYTGTFSNGQADLLVYKLDSSGQKQWRKNYGGSESEYGGYIRQTSDGGYILSGDTYTYSNGVNDLLVYKLDASGNKQWRKNYGGDNYDYGRNILQTTDGGYILGGFGHSYTHGMTDFLVYKLDAKGFKQWRKNYGGTDHENLGNVGLVNQ